MEPATDDFESLISHRETATNSYNKGNDDRRERFSGLKCVRKRSQETFLILKNIQKFNLY